MGKYFFRKTILNEPEAVNSIWQGAFPLNKTDYQALLMRGIRNARIVIPGESNRGTIDNYTWCAFIAQQTMQKKGFNIIAVESEWPDCYRLNRYIKNYDGTSKNIFEVLNEFN